MARSGNEASIASPWLSSTASGVDVNTPLAKRSRTSLTIAPDFHCKDAGMPDDSVVVYARGHYRVVRIEEEEPRDRYVILDTAGTELRREPGFDQAKAWVDRRAIDPTPPRPARRRHA